MYFFLFFIYLLSLDSPLAEGRLRMFRSFSPSRRSLQNTSGRCLITSERFRDDPPRPSPTRKAIVKESAQYLPWATRAGLVISTGRWKCNRARPSCRWNWIPPCWRPAPWAYPSSAARYFCSPLPHWRRHTRHCPC